MKKIGIALFFVIFAGFFYSCASIPVAENESLIVINRTSNDFAGADSLVTIYINDVVVYDDASTDDTASVAERAGAIVLRHAQNAGKGQTLRDGLNWACENDYTAVVTLDGDGQHLPEEINRFLEKIGEADLIIGNRMFECDNMPFVRTCTNRFTSWVISLLAKQKIHDSQVGFRLITCDCWRGIDIKSNNFEFEGEMLIAASRKGFRIAEVPISTVYGDEKSKIRPVRDTIRFFKMIWRLWRSK